MKFHAPAHGPVTRFAITIPNFEEFGSLAISPDGSAVVFDALRESGGSSEFYLRRFDQLTATPIAGTEDASGPSFSPNGKWVSFVKNGSLMKVMPNSGTVQTICPLPGVAGASWVDDSTIIFSQRGSGLFRVSAEGGTPELVAPIGPQTDRQSRLLPATSSPWR
jgi:Tol biopolymer transport system component